MRYKTVLVSAVMIFFSCLLFAETEEWETRIESVPQNIENFVKLRNQTALTPGDGAAMFVLAMIIYAENPDAGMDVFTATLVNDGSLLQKAGKKIEKKTYGGMIPGNNARYLLKRIDNALYLPRSYVSGTTPQNGYSLPPFPLKIKTFTNVHSYIDEKTVKVYVYCSGADTPRPLTMKVNNRGIWKVKEFSSLVVGIREPEEIADDEL